MHVDNDNIFGSDCCFSVCEVIKVLYLNRGHDPSTVEAVLWKTHVVKNFIQNLVKVTWSAK